MHSIDSAAYIDRISGRDPALSVLDRSKRRFDRPRIAVTAIDSDIDCFP